MGRDAQDDSNLGVGEEMGIKIPDHLDINQVNPQATTEPIAKTAAANNPNIGPCNCKSQAGNGYKNLFTKVNMVIPPKT